MDLIFGGAYQGKLTWAVERYALCRQSLWDLSQGAPGQAFGCFYHLEALTWQEAEGGGSAQALLQRMEPFWGDAIVISREIGSGVVPMDATQRLWRELHGQVLRALAGRAQSVTRIFCGLPEVLK